MAERYEIIITADTRNALRSLTTFNRQLARTDRGLGALARQTRTTESAFIRLGRAAGALAGIVGAGALGKAIINVNRRLEILQNTLGTVFGSATKGQAAFERIQQLAIDTPLSIDALSQSFIKLKASGIEPTNELMTKFADVAAVTTDAVGTLQAVTDLYSRTTAGGLGLEDLNRLADRGIPVFDILSKRLGVNRLQISKLGQTAEGAALIIKNLEEGFERFGGAAERNSNTIDNKLTTLSTAFDNLALSFGKGGFNDVVKDALNGITTVVTDLKDGVGELGSITHIVFNDLANIVKFAFGELKDGAELADDGLGNVISKGITLTNVFATIRTVFIGLVNSFKIGFETLKLGFTTILKLIGITAGALVEAFPQAIKKVADLFKSLGTGINTILDRIKTNVVNFGAAFTAAVDAIIDFEDPRDAFKKKFKPISLSDAFDFSDVKDVQTNFDAAISALNTENAKAALDIAKFAEENFDLSDVFNLKKVIAQVDATKKALAGLTLKSKTTDDDTNSNNENAISVTDQARAQELLAASTKKATDAQKQQKALNESIQKSFKSLGESVGRWAAGSKDAIRGVIAELIRLAALKIFGSISPFTSGLLSGVGQVQGFADGGNFSAGQTFLVGERGPELITSNAAGTVIPNSQLGSGGGVVINPTLSINGSVIATDELKAMFVEFAETVGEATKEAFIQNNRFGGLNAS